MSGTGSRLVAGASGSGKSVVTLRAIKEMVQIPKEERVIAMIDCKQGVEAAKARRVVDAIATDIETADIMLTNIKGEMQRRGDLILNCPDPEKYWDSKIPPDKETPLIICVIDELAVLASPIKGDKEKEDIRKHAFAMFTDLLFLARFAGVCIIACIQRADASLISGFARNNLQVRIVGRTASKTDSEVCLGTGTSDVADASRLTNHWFILSAEGRDYQWFKTPMQRGDADLKSVFLNPKYFAPEGRGDWLLADPDSAESVAPWWAQMERRQAAERDAIKWDSAYRRNDSYDDEDAYGYDDDDDDLGAEFDEGPDAPAQPSVPEPIDLSTMATMLGVSVEDLEELQRQNAANSSPSPTPPARPSRGERAAARAARAAAADGFVIESRKNRKASRQPLGDDLAAEQAAEQGADLMRGVFQEIDEYLDEIETKEKESLEAEFSEDDDELVDDMDDTTMIDDDFDLDDASPAAPDVSDLREFASSPEEFAAKTRRMSQEADIEALRRLVMGGPDVTSGPASTPDAAQPPVDPNEPEGSTEQPAPASQRRRPAAAASGRSGRPVDKASEKSEPVVERRQQAKPDQESPSPATKAKPSGGRGRKPAPARQRTFTRR